MKFNEYNPYYDPEKCGLEILEDIDYSGSYEYDKLVIWKKLDGSTIWYDIDSGCSCPSPFDNSDHGHDLIQITKDTFYNFQEALKNHSGVELGEYMRVSNLIKDLI